MKKNIIIMASFLLTSSAIANIDVIVHPSNSASIDSTAITKIFTGKSKSYSDGNKAVPVSQKASTAATTEFNAKVLKKSASQLKARWSKLIFTGKGTPPKELASDADVIKHVSLNPNSIGFVTKGTADGSVKVIQSY